MVISSIPLRDWLHQVLPPNICPPRSEGESETEFLVSIASSTQDPSGSSPSAVYAQCVACIPGYFSGVGDLFSALVLAHYKPQKPPASESPSAISWAVSQALLKTHAILSLTQEHASQLPVEERQPTDDELDEKEPERMVRRMKGRELRLIQGQEIIRSDKFASSHMEAWRVFWESSS